jgi:biotin operon repressor
MVSKSTNPIRFDKTGSRFISQSELARRLGVGRTTVYRNMARYRANGLKESQIGGRALIDAHTIESMLLKMRTDR